MVNFAPSFFEKRADLYLDQMKLILLFDRNLDDVMDGPIVPRMMMYQAAVGSVQLFVVTEADVGYG